MTVEVSPIQPLVRGHSATSGALLAPVDRTPESFTRGAYRFFDHDAVTLPALQTPIEQALTQLVPVGGLAYVAHDLSVLNYSGHQRKEDLIAVGNDRTFGYELYQALVISADGKPLGAAVTELHNAQGLLSSTSTDVLPFRDHLEQTERAVDVVEKMLPGRTLASYVRSRSPSRARKNWLLTPVPCELFANDMDVHRPD